MDEKQEKAKIDLALKLAKSLAESTPHDSQRFHVTKNGGIAITNLSAGFKQVRKSKNGNVVTSYNYSPTYAFKKNTMWDAFVTRRIVKQDILHTVRPITNNKPRPNITPQDRKAFSIAPCTPLL